MKTHEQYEQELFEKELNFIPLERYTLSHSNILHECINGHKFYATPSNILRGRGCLICSGRHSTKPKSTAEHIQDLFIYNSNWILKEGQVYTNSKNPLIYVCGNGHEKYFKPADILQGHDCIDCIPRGRYNSTYFSRNPEYKEKPGILYIVKLEAYDEVFIKIGITKDNSPLGLNKRIKTYNHLNPVVLLFINTTLEKAFTTEQFILNKYKEHRYKAKKPFPGHTELLCISVINSILKDIAKEIDTT